MKEKFAVGTHLKILENLSESDWWCVGVCRSIFSCNRIGPVEASNTSRWISSSALKRALNQRVLHQRDYFTEASSEWKQRQLLDKCFLLVAFFSAQLDPLSYSLSRILIITHFWWAKRLTISARKISTFSSTSLNSAMSVISSAIKTFLIIFQVQFWHFGFLLLFFFQHSSRPPPKKKIKQSVKLKLAGRK